MSTLFPALRPTLPGFLPHRCDSKSALGGQRSGQSPAGSALGAARPDFWSCSKPRISESSEATDSFGWSEVLLLWDILCRVGRESEQRRKGVSWAWASVRRSRRCTRERYAGGLGHGGRGAGRRWRGAGDSVPVFPLINDAHVAARVSGALSPASGLAERTATGMDGSALGAHPAGARSLTLTTPAAPSGRGPGFPQAPVPAGFRVWLSRGLEAAGTDAAGAAGRSRARGRAGTDGGAGGGGGEAGARDRGTDGG